MSYFITGDCHADFDHILWFIDHHKVSDSDVMIILGDVGLNYYMNDLDEKNKELLEKTPLTYLCIHGNHEERPYNIKSYKTKEWSGGIVYYEEAYPHILFAKDGEIYSFGDKKAIAIGGAYSVGKDFRLKVGLPWFEDEQPSKEIKAHVENRLDMTDWTVDYVFSHTCPNKYIPRDLFLDCIDPETVDMSTENWLSGLEERMIYKRWYFGHYHGNRTYDKADMLYGEIRELGSKTFTQRIGRPLYKEGQRVMFRDGDSERDFAGMIVRVKDMGSDKNVNEVAYDIDGADSEGVRKVSLYKDIEESGIRPFERL